MLISVIFRNAPNRYLSQDRRRTSFANATNPTSRPLAPNAVTGENTSEFQLLRLHQAPGGMLAQRAILAG